MRNDNLIVLAIVIVMLASVTGIAAQFKPATLDKSATYAIRMTEAADGSGWKVRETFKLCELPRPVEGARFAVIAKTKACPQ